MRGLANGRVLHAEVAVHRAHDHLPAIQAHSHMKGDALGALHLSGILFDHPGRAAAAALSLTSRGTSHGLAFPSASDLVAAQRSDHRDDRLGLACSIDLLA
jgi:hypothetical protein